MVNNKFLTPLELPDGHIIAGKPDLGPTLDDIPTHMHASLIQNPGFEYGFQWWVPEYNGQLQTDENNSGNGWKIVYDAGINYFTGRAYANHQFTGGEMPAQNSMLLTGTRTSSKDPSFEQIPFLRDVWLNVFAWVGKRGTWGGVPAVGVVRVRVDYYRADGSWISGQAGNWWEAGQIASLTDTDAGNLTPIGARFRSTLSGTSLRDAVYVRAGVEVNSAAEPGVGSTTHLVVGQVHAQYAPASEFLGYHRVTLSGTTALSGSSTWNKVPWSTVEADGGWGSGIDLLCPVGGTYVVSAFSHFAQAATRAITNIAVTTNASPVTSNSYGRVDDSLEGSSSPMQSVSAILYLSTGNPLNLYVWSNAASPSLGAWTTMTIARIG